MFWCSKSGRAELHLLKSGGVGIAIFGEVCAAVCSSVPAGASLDNKEVSEHTDCSPLVWVVSSGALRLPSESGERGTKSKDTSDDRARHATRSLLPRRRSMPLPTPCFTALDVCWRFSGARWDLQTEPPPLGLDGSAVPSNRSKHAL